MPSTCKTILVKTFSIFCCLVQSTIVAETWDSKEHEKKGKPKTIAIIGGAITGSFVTKYLADYDAACTKIDSITIFDSNPSIDGQPVLPNNGNVDPDSVRYPGSRIRSLKLQPNGEIIEVGASIGYKGFYHVIEMIQNDPTLEMLGPFATGINESSTTSTSTSKKYDGFGIFDGVGNPWALITAGATESKKKLLMLLRYNWDIYKVSNKLKHFLSKWATLPKLMNSLHPDTFYNNPDEIWTAIDLYTSAHVSFDKFLQTIGVTLYDPENSRVWTWWNKLFPFHGSIRRELLSAINLVNYNQNTANVNGVTGMGSFAASTGGLFSIKGGNVRLIASAFQQATEKRQQACTERDDVNTIIHIRKRVTAVMGNLDGFSIYADQEVLGLYDILILAAPIQQSQISFLTQSHMDSAVIQEMPLGGLVQAHDNDNHDSSQVTLPPPMPGVARRPYKHVTTTVVSNAVLALDLLSYHVLPNDNILPKSVIMTDQGKSSMYNITAITSIQDGVYKIFSDTKLDATILQKLFGTGVFVEDVTIWGDGRNGGATPDYRGQGQSSDFLLYDSAAGMEGHTTSGALYYPNAMEQSALSCMEISAVGAKAVAKLIAKRLGMIVPTTTVVTHDEL
jgi:prenylcysteine oxidase / farnesylcysteine lyase